MQNLIMQNLLCNIIYYATFFMQHLLCKIYYATFIMQHLLCSICYAKFICVMQQQL